jgi:hypothetical protein
LANTLNSTFQAHQSTPRGADTARLLRYITGMDAASGPSGGLHALVIGVSSYPNAERYGLKSVAGPAVAAARFAQWLRSSYQNPHVRLKSLRVLLSPTEAEAAATADAVGPTDGRGNSTDVINAVASWADDCNKAASDIGLLYFAGHGTSMVVGGGFLILEDFGHPAAPLTYALNLQYLLDAMSTRLARSNFFFIDACRSTIKAQEDHELTGIMNLIYNRKAPVHRQILKVCYAAAPDLSAWTTADNEVLQYGTVFFKALLRALNQSAVELGPDGRLCVMANRLASETARGVSAEARYLSKTYAREILGAGDGIGTLEEVPFHWPTAVPVDLDIELDPAASATSATGSLYRVVSTARARHDRDVSFDPHPCLIGNIDAGKYRLQVSLPAGAVTDDWLVLPSTCHWKVVLPDDYV